MAGTVRMAGARAGYLIWWIMMDDRVTPRICTTGGGVSKSRCKQDQAKLLSHFLLFVQRVISGYTGLTARTAREKITVSTMSATSWTK